MIGSIIAGTTVAATGLTAYGMFKTKSTLLAPSIWRGPQNRPAIALTFDDGPSESTAAILAILQQYRITATFFQCGLNVRRLPQVTRDVKAAGHELGNHTYTHPHLYFKSPGFIYRELARTQETIEETTGVKPVLFRAPFGIRWYGLRRAQRRLGLTGVMWTAIGFDWARPADRVSAFLRRQAANGAIFCLHDGRRTTVNPDISETVKAVAALIPMLLDSGFHFESVGQMRSRGNIQNAEVGSNAVSSHS
ncbi:MAG: polysaccharide deacetylase family protein [Candidatus Angelobacter sp.]